jgi:glutathione S-transferase
MYTLYYAPGAASLLPHLALLETGAPYELKLVDTAAKQQKSPEYLKLNPNGVVPTLIVDGAPMAEAAAMALLLAERHPEAKLAPAPGSPQRALFLQWMLHFANVVQPTFRLWWYPDEAGGEASPARVGVQQRIEAGWDRLDAHLAAHGPYMLGNEFSVADLYATMLMRWSRNMPRPALQWPHMAALAVRVRSRDSWKKLYAVEGLTEWA